MEISSLGNTPPVVAPGVVASPHCVALSIALLAGRRLEEVSEARNRFGDRRWRACLCGFKSDWDACCFSTIGEDLPAPPARVRWSHTLREEERVFAVTPLLEDSLRIVAGAVERLDRCADQEVNCVSIRSTRERRSCIPVSRSTIPRSSSP